MKILRLEITDIGGIEAFELDASGDHVIIGGPNRAGKTSVLNAIAGALGGGKNRKSLALRKGAKKGQVVVDLGDLVVRWRTNDSGKDYLEVSNADGASYKSPQAMLDRLWGARSFDPLRFFEASSKDQAAMLAELSGVDLVAMDERRSEVFAERTAVNRLAKEIEAQAKNDAYSTPDDLPAEPIDEKALVAALEAARVANADRQMLSRRLDIAVEEADEAIAATKQARDAVDGEVAAVQAAHDQLVEEARQALDRAEERRDLAVDDARARAKAAVAEAERREENAKAALRVHEQAMEEVGVEIDTIPLEQDLEHARELNRLVVLRQSKERLEAGAKAQREKAQALTEALETIDQEKLDALSNASLPVAGLGLVDGAVTLDGRPLDVLSGEERLRVAVAIDIARHPEIGVMLIDRWGDLDEASRGVMRELAEASGCQIWTTIVGERDEDITVVIREGRVVEEQEI